MKMMKIRLTNFFNKLRPKTEINLNKACEIEEKLSNIRGYIQYALIKNYPEMDMPYCPGEVKALLKKYKPYRKGSDNIDNLCVICKGFLEEYPNVDDHEYFDYIEGHEQLKRAYGHYQGYREL